jgi:hypothetical protein
VWFESELVSRKQARTSRTVLGPTACQGNQIPHNLAVVPYAYREISFINSGLLKTAQA